MKKKNQKLEKSVAADFGLNKKDVAAGLTLRQEERKGENFMSDLNAIYEMALKERDELLEKIKPLKQQEQEVLTEMAPLEKKLREIREAIVTIETPRLAELSQIISALAPKAKRLHAEPGSFGVKM